MENFYDIFDDFAHRFYNLPMFPLFQCGHFIIVTLGLRRKIGKIVHPRDIASASATEAVRVVVFISFVFISKKLQLTEKLELVALELVYFHLTITLGLTFARNNPLACWVSTLVANVSGVLLINLFLGRPIIQFFQDERQIMIITGIWYFTFFCPKDLFYKVLTTTPCFTIIILLKEAHRAKGILAGIDLGMQLYPDAVLITVIFGFLKGAAGLLTEPLAAAIRGTLTIANNEAVKPSYNSKVSVCVSIIYTMCHKGIITVHLPCLCLAAYIALAVVQVTLYWTGSRDPFIFIENALSPFCFGSSSLENSSTASKKSKNE